MSSRLSKLTVQLGADSKKIQKLKFDILKELKKEFNKIQKTYVDIRTKEFGGCDEAFEEGDLERFRFLHNKMSDLEDQAFKTSDGKVESLWGSDVADLINGIK